MFKIIEATAQDTDRWRSLRRDGIAHYPDAFLLTLAQHDASDPASDAARLESGGKFIAFDGTTPVGLIGLNAYGSPNMRHRAEIGPLYVIPEAQGTPAAMQLLQAAVDHATAKGIWQLDLTVNEANTRAIAFYKRDGFLQYGCLPNVVIGPDGPEHDLMMLRTLPQATPSFFPENLNPVPATGANAAPLLSKAPFPVNS